MNNDTYTENMADIMACSNERKEVLAIMQAWDNDGLPENFDSEGVRFGFNRNSGYVFLVNDDCQCAMLNDGKLELFLTSPYDGHEGFLSDLVNEVDEDLWSDEDIEWLNELRDNQD